MLLDRRAISTFYDVLPVIPLPTGVEKLTWATNIFIASDLNETRSSLSPYPAITITYNFKVSCSSRSWLRSLPTSPNNTWMLAYFPYSSPGVVSGGNLTIPPQDGVEFPYGPFLLVYVRGRRTYYAANRTATSRVGVPITDFNGDVLVAPCFEAVIDPAIKYTDMGKTDGSVVSLTFRMTGESEKMMTYHVDNFDFVSAVQRPVQVEARRRQSNYAPPPGPIHTYSPIAYKENQIPKSSVTYWLDYLATRKDYLFRGAMMKRLGAATADNYVESTKLHRLQNDQVTINHNLRVNKATVMMREVTG